MARRTILAISMLALATMCSPAFAAGSFHKPEPGVVKAERPSSFDEAPFWTITPDKYRYHGGPKSTCERPANDPFASMLLG
jgi:hypothetical protein